MVNGKAACLDDLRLKLNKVWSTPLILIDLSVIIGTVVHSILTHWLEYGVGSLCMCVCACVRAHACFKRA